MMRNTDPVDFRELLARVRNGDEHARNQLIEGCYPRVEQLVHNALAKDLRQGRPWISARFSTGDVVQDVFRKLIEDLSGFAGGSEGELIAYLAVAVRHRLLDTVRYHEAERRDGRRTGDIAGLHSASGNAASPLSDLVAAEEHERLRRVLETFPPKERALLEGRLLGGATFDELRQRLGYTSMRSARAAYYSAEARLVIRLGSQPEQ